MNVSIIVAIITSTALVAVAIIAYVREVRLKRYELKIKQQSETHERESNEIKLQSRILERLIDFSTFNELRDSVDRIFNKTKANKFYIFMALNGKTDFNVISLIFEQHDSTKTTVNAIVRFKQVPIDNKWREIIKESEVTGPVHLDTSEMPPQLLKDMFMMNDTEHSVIRHLHRDPIDDENHVVTFSTLSTNKPTKYTEKENAVINSEFEGNIVPAITRYLDN